MRQYHLTPIGPGDTKGETRPAVRGTGRVEHHGGCIGIGRFHAHVTHAVATVEQGLPHPVRLLAEALTARPGQDRSLLQADGACRRRLLRCTSPESPLPRDIGGIDIRTDHQGFGLAPVRTVVDPGGEARLRHGADPLVFQASATRCEAVELAIRPLSRILDVQRSPLLQPFAKMFATGILVAGLWSHEHHRLVGERQCVIAAGCMPAGAHICHPGTGDDLGLADQPQAGFRITYRCRILVAGRDAVGGLRSIGRTGLRRILPDQLDELRLQLLQLLGLLPCIGFLLLQCLLCSLELDLQCSVSCRRFICCLSCSSPLLGVGRIDFRGSFDGFATRFFERRALCRSVCLRFRGRPLGSSSISGGIRHDLTCRGRRRRKRYSDVGRSIACGIAGRIACGTGNRCCTILPPSTPTCGESGSKGRDQHEMMVFHAWKFLLMFPVRETSSSCSPSWGRLLVEITRNTKEHAPDVPGSMRSGTAASASWRHVAPLTPRF